MSERIVKTTFLIFVTVVSVCFQSLAQNHETGLNQFQAQVTDSANKFVKGTARLEQGNYVVVGAFVKYNNAVNFTRYVSGKGYNSAYGVRNDKDYYYVYLFRSNLWEDAVTKTYKVREDEELHDAWVMKVGNNKAVRVPEEELQKAQQAIIANKTVEDPGIKEEWEDDMPDPQADETPAAEDTSERENQDIEGLTASVVKEAVSSVASGIEIKKGEIKGDYFLFAKTYRDKDNQPVQSAIQLVDNVRAKLIKQIRSNELQGVWDPRNGTSSIKLICNLFGYRKLEHNIKLKNPVTDSTRNFVNVKGNVINVDFKLERLKPGDIAVMYNVYFFNDAAIMRPESKFEVNSLLEMMKENDKMKIKIHGHTNGGKAGKIIKLGKDQNNYFSMSKDNIDGFGTARDLSAERGEVIKKYLMENGIDGKRLAVKGWGGKKMLYDRGTPQAKKNIRVEIEILQD